MTRKNRKPPDELKVFIVRRETQCGECGADLGHNAWIFLRRDKGTICLVCADLDHLVYLPSGDATLTRRARKNSKLSAVVLKWSRARKRYERQGLLVGNEALEKAERDCDADESERESRRANAALRRAELDKEYIRSFAIRVRQIYPFCPDGREMAIAEHACRKYSGRVGRSSAAKVFDEGAVRLAVKAHIRHAETHYDELLLRFFDRHDARNEVKEAVARILYQWEYGSSD